ncbi:MAG: hypothetical protein NT031_16300 [Planctomycetota bacterium]|nr:hypothetical protein [Planctomycetota bacterium]
MSDYDDYRPSGMARWWSRGNPLSASWISLLCLAGIAWMILRYARGVGTVWILLTQICVLLTFAVSPWCRHAIARGSRARKLLILLPILLLLLAVTFFRQELGRRTKTPGPDRAQTSSRPAAPASGPASSPAR